MVSKTLAISFLLALTSAQVPDMEANYRVNKVLTGVDGADDTEVTGWATLKHAAGVITGRVCYESNVNCTPEAGWAVGSCLDVTQGTYAVDDQGEGYVPVIEGYIFNDRVTRSFIVGDEVYTGGWDVRSKQFVVGKVHTKSSVFEGSILGTIDFYTNYTGDDERNASLYCPSVPFGNTLIQVVEGNNGGACKSDRSCTDIAGEGEAAATPQCCGTGTSADGDALTDVCGDGLATEETFTPGFKRAGVDYAHACSAFKLVSSAASAIATAYLM